MDTEKIIESLSVNEMKILPHINESRVGEISKKSGLDKVSVLRALEYLEKKGLVSLSHAKRRMVEIEVNGALYRKKGLPERRLLNLVGEKRVVPLSEAAKQAGLSDEELKAAIGVLKRKDLVNLKSEKLMLKSGKNEVSKKMPEETLIESLPLDYGSLTEDQMKTMESLEKRKDILSVMEKTVIGVKATELGRKAMESKTGSGMIEQITPQMLGDDSLWKGKKFRRYDVVSQVPRIYGGRRHFVNQAADYARRVWLDMGFAEMSGSIAQSSFWNFDALFTAQDHPVREMQDTFFLSQGLREIDADKKTVNQVRKSHEGTLKEIESKGWGYKWDEDEAKKMVLRTHTTALSALALAKLKSKSLPAKFFALGKCFRNETVDWKHSFEFNQAEGIVVDKNANFRHLFGYLREFFGKMGFEKIRFRPGYFPYTEPSVEIDAFHEGRKEWIELGGAGIFRPEVVVPLLGENVPVLAWGPGFDRILMDHYKIQDIRELYNNDLKQLRKIKFWMGT
jgi:phenylalanyl-tRNA synthetase alpha chain